MELLDSKRSVVVAIDFQGKLMEMIHRPGLVVASAVRLLNLADIFGVPVIMTEQYPKGLGPTHPEIRAAFDSLSTKSFYMEKTSFGCCGDPAFEKLLDHALPGLPAGCKQVVIGGIEAQICVMQTALELLSRGYQVFLCWECVSGRGEEYRMHAIDRMVQAGAVLTNHESVAFEWARHKDHPGFKAVNALLREGQLSG